MSPYDGIKVTRVGPAIAMVKLNRPPNNFIAQPLVAAIADAYEELGHDSEVRVVILAAEGKNFCAGADFASPNSGATTTANADPLSARTVMQTYSQGARIMAAPLPVVAAINGAAVGEASGSPAPPTSASAVLRRAWSRTFPRSASITASV